MAGKKYIVTTRPASKFKPVEGEFCFSIVNIPLTEVKLRDLPEVKDEILEFNPDIIITTSELSSERLVKIDFSGKLDFFIAIGDKSAAPLKGTGIQTLIPEEKTSSGIVELLSSMDLASRRIALCRSSVHSMIIDRYLAQSGIEFRSIDIYDIHKTGQEDIISQIEDPACVGVLVTSSMEAKLLVELANTAGKPALLDRKSVFSIGKPTTNTLTELGISVELLKTQSSIEQILLEIKEKHCHSGEWI